MANQEPDRMLDMQQARTAGTRYSAVVAPQPTAMATAVISNEIVSDPPADNRKKYLKASLTRELVRATVSEAESRGARRNPEDTLASLSQERIIDKSDMRDINYLELAIASAWFSIRYAYETEASEWGARAERDAKAALAADPSLAEATLAMASAAGTLHGAFNWPIVIADAKRALAIDPTWDPRAVGSHWSAAVRAGRLELG